MCDLSNISQMSEPKRASGNMSNFSAESYFETQPAPPNLGECVSDVRKFIDKHSQGGKRVVLVTVRAWCPWHG